MKALIICAVIAIVLIIVAAVAVIMILSRKDRSPAPAPAAIPAAPAAPVIALSPVIIQGIRDHARVYEGLYEPVYLAAHSPDRDAEAYTEWCERTDAHGSAAYREAFAAEFSIRDGEDPALLAVKLERLLRCIRAAGIHRDANTGDIFVYSQSDDKKYFGAPGVQLAGSSCRIVKPAWMMGGDVIEPGLVMPAG